MLRSIGAVVVGFLYIAALSFGADALLRTLVPGAFATGRIDDPMLLLFAQLYVGVFAISGCYLTARLAPSKPMRHALVLGALGLVFNVAGTVAMWDTAPAWFHIMALALVIPFAWAGGRLREVELARRSRSGGATAGASLA
jgi:hypothetical protein